ncbi:hypothetical protein U9M48_004219 [Paspalum notatum var. saurae]|uniref:Uncharacterized protein n=1 Tax=Paspalum notatum var. saurae TaxID=547442 RepID=A0AAQ3SKM2_PASNO
MEGRNDESAGRGPKEEDKAPVTDKRGPHNGGLTEMLSHPYIPPTKHKTEPFYSSNQTQI